MQKKSWIALLLVAIMVLALAACNSGTPSTTGGGTSDGGSTDGGSSEPDSQETMNLTVAVWSIADAFPDDTIDPMKQSFYDRFNVTLEPMAITWGDATERYQVWASSGSMPDICGGLAIVGGGQYYQWIEDGVVRAIPDDLAAYPNVQKYMSLSEVIAYQVDGTNYILPRMTYQDSRWWCMDRGIMYRKDWLENVGLDLPESTEDFINMLIAFTEQDPDGNGADDTVGMTLCDVVVTSQFFPNFGYNAPFWYKVGDQYVVPEVEEGAVAVVDMMRTAYKAGAIDPDYASYVGADEPTEKFASSRAGVYSKQVSPGHIKGVYDKWQELQPDLDFFECVGILPMWDVPGSDTAMFVERGFWSETYLGGHVDDATAARILTIYDWMYSSEGMKFFAYGFEGEDYEYDDDGNIVITLPPKEDGRPGTLSDKYVFANGMPSLACWTGDMQQYENPNTPQGILDMCVAERDSRLANWTVPVIDWEVVAINVPEKQETTYDSKVLWNQIIMNETDASTADLYEGMKQELESGGYYKMVDAVNAAAKEMGK